LWTLCPGWPRTWILLISASKIAHISGMSHWHLTTKIILKLVLHYCISWGNKSFFNKYYKSELDLSFLEINIYPLYI
jgi:hypothetical protein